MFTYLGETIIKRSCRVRRTLNTPDKNIKEAIVPYGITTIDDCFHHEGIMFSGCSSLVNITIPNSFIYNFKDIFFYSSKISDIVILEGIKDIPNKSFSGCSSLVNITIPNSVTKISKSAFEGCSSLTNITIPNSVI